MTSPAPSAPVDEDRASAAAVRGLAQGGSTAIALWSLYVLTLRQHLHGRRWMVMGVLFLLPAGLALLVRATAPDAPSVALEFLLGFMFIPQALLPLVALLYASGIIQDEQEEQTITYLLIRPIPKWALYTVKLLATLTTTVLLTVVFTLLTYAAIYVGADSAVGANTAAGPFSTPAQTSPAPADAAAQSESAIGPGRPSGADVVGGSEAAPRSIPLRALKAAAIHSLAVVAYCCLFGLLSLVTKRILVVGIIYAAVVEGLLANLPFGIRLVTVIYYTRLISYRTLDFIMPRPQGGTENLAAEAWQLNVQKDPGLLEHPQLGTCLTVLLVASLVCTILAAWLCGRREFHVKTPEKE